MSKEKQAPAPTTVAVEADGEAVDVKVLTAERDELREQLAAARTENAELKGHFEAARQELQEFLDADAEEAEASPVERLLLAFHTLLVGILGESHTPEDTERVLIRLGEDAQYNVYYPENLTRGLMGIAAEVRKLQAERSAE